MRVLFMVLILGIILNFAFPYFLNEGRGTSARNIYQRPTFSSVMSWDSSSILPDAQNVARASAPESNKRVCFWTCGPDAFDKKVCNGALLENGVVSRSESRTSPTQACTAETCGKIFSDFSKICPTFELQSTLWMKHPMIHFGSICPDWTLVFKK